MFIGTIAFYFESGSLYICMERSAGGFKDKRGALAAILLFRYVLISYPTF